MGYIKKKITETVAHEKNVGMICDTCGKSTNTLDDDDWHGFLQGRMILVVTATMTGK